MKNEIIGIMQSCVNVWDIEASGGSPVPVMKDEYIWITEGIQRLMCYREVRAYWRAVDEFNDSKEYDMDQEVLGSFSEAYPESMIIEAIEKVKNEYK